MPLLSVDYRPPQPRPPIINRRSVRLFLLVMAAIVIIAGAIYRLSIDRQGAAVGTTQTLVIRIADAKTNAPIPLIVNGPNYAGADPWQRKVTRIARDTIQIQWVERDTPASILLNSPGYQSVGVFLSHRQLPQIAIGLWPDPPTTAPTTSPVVPTPTR